MEKNKVFEIIVSHTKQVLPDLENHNFSRSDSLRDLGANSVDRAEITMMTLESLGLSVPMSQLAKSLTLGDLVNAIAQHQ